MTPLDHLRELGLRRKDLIRTRVGLTNRIKAICRRAVGCEGKDDKDGSAKADKIYDALTKIHTGKTVDSDLACVVSSWCAPFFAARDQIQQTEKALNKAMRKIARELPVYSWVSDVRGFGDGNLAYIIAETGDLSNYAGPAKVWKRMGLAVIHGERQRKTTDKDLAIEMGYSPTRRAIMFNLGDCLIKAQGKGDAAGPYRKIYDARKVYEKERNPEIPDGHAHNRARRYMEKRVLRDLWRAWRRV
jgi:hypothetical protein